MRPTSRMPILSPASAELRSAQQVLHERLAIFRVRPYALYFAGHIVSMTGTGMQLIANGWLALQLTHTSLSVAIVLMASTLPGVLLAPIVGVYVDRFDRRILAASMDLFRGCVLLGIPLLWWLHQLQPWHLYLMAFCLGFGDYTYNASVLGLIREVVPADQLLLANATTGVAAQVGGAVGAPLAGLVIVLSNPVVVMLINAVSFFFSAGCIIAMRRGVRPARDAATPLRTGRQFWRDFAAGVHYIREHRHLIGLYAVMLVVLATLRTINVLLPAFAKEVLAVGPAGFGYIDGMFGVGAILGNLLLPALSGPAVSAWAMPSGVLVLAASVWLFAASHHLETAMLGYFCIGLAYPVRALYQTAAQHATDLDVQGRVHTTFGIFFTLSTLSVYLIMGTLSQALSLRWLYAGQGALVATAGILALVVSLRGRRGRVRRLATETE